MAELAVYRDVRSKRYRFDIMSNHDVWREHTIKRGKIYWYVIECRCGWSTALHTTLGVAKSKHREHSETAAVTLL